MPRYEVMVSELWEKSAIIDVEGHDADEARTGALALAKDKAFDTYWDMNQVGEPMTVDSITLIPE